MIDVDALMTRVDRQAFQAFGAGMLAFGCALSTGASLVWDFSRQSLIPWGDFDHQTFNSRSFLANLDWPTIAGRLVLHVGAVLIGIFMVQLMFGIGRYYCRLSSHLRMFGNLILVTEGDPTMLSRLASSLLPSSLDFGRTPQSPVERVLVAAVDAVGRSTARKE